MTEPADHSRDPRHEATPSGSPASDSAASDSATSDVVDAEIVEDTTTTGGASTSSGGPNLADDEEFRQYQQFREFQKFQEWQRQQGMSGQSDQPGPSTPPPPPPQVTGSRPWWKRLLRLLRFKWIRRLLYVFILIIVLYAFIRSMFGGAGDSTQEYQPGQPPAPNPQPVLQTEPKTAVITMYDYIATKPGSVCILLNDSAREAFARHHGAADCEGAARKLNQRVDNENTYKNPKLGEDAVETVHNPELGGPANVPNDAVVRACQITVDGGPKLGDFGLRRESTGGWVIDGYEPAARCP